MKLYQQYIGNTDGVHHLTNANGNTNDIMDTVVYADTQLGNSCSELVKQLAVYNDPVATCYNIWRFWKQNVKYIEDPEGVQLIKSPAYMYSVGDTLGADCKSLSVGVAACLKQLGIPYAYRFITQDANNPFHHVYIVAYTTAGNVLIDCVIDYFNRENKYVRKRDIQPQSQIAPMPKARIGKVSKGVHYIPNNIGKIDVGPPNPGGYWENMVSEYKRDYYHLRAKALNYAIKDIINQYGPKHPIKNSMYLDSLRKNWNDWMGMAYSMAYYFWDDYDTPLPAQFDEKRKFGKELYDLLISIGFRQPTLLLMCDLGVYKLMGIPLQYAIYRAKCVTKWGQPWEPVYNVPYWNVKTGALIENGGGLDKAFQIASCMPYMGSGNVQALGLPDGVPYWCIGGWVMRNGASEQTLEQFIKDNPDRPNINIHNNPTQQQRDDAISTYYKWRNGNLVALPGIVGQKSSNGKVDVFKVNGVGAAYGAGEAAAIVTVVVICISVALSIASTIAGIVLAVKKAKAKGNQVIPDFKSDFKEIYQTADGCIMYQSASTGQLKKCCTGLQCQDNPNPNQPQNQPASGNFGGEKSYTWLFIAAAVLLGAFFIIPKSNKN